MRPLTRSCFLLLLLGKLFLLDLPFLLGICHPSPWSPPFLLHAPALIPLSLTHLDSIPPHDLVLWTDSSVPFLFGIGDPGILANCSLCGNEATLSFLAGPVCSSFSAEASAILNAFCWSRQHHKVCHFCSHHPVLPVIFPPTLNSLAGTVFSLLLFYQVTMGTRTLVSPGKRRD